MAPDMMKALKVVGVGQAEIQDVPLPRLRDDYVLVKVNAVAVNPTDWRHVHIPALAEEGIGCTIGCDYAGVVVDVGSKVTKDWKKGDRIAGFVHGANSVEKEDGCFAEYAVAKGDAGQMKLPDSQHPGSISDEEACTMGAGVTTVGQVLYQRLGLPLPGSDVKANKDILIYGGSTATGSLAIQYATLSGCRVVTTCSPRNFPFVKALGAAQAFDYSDPDCAKKIREYTKDNLTLVFDCISEGTSPSISSESISSKGGVVLYLVAAKHDRQDVENKHTSGFTFTGEYFEAFGEKSPPSKEDFEFQKMFWDLSTTLVTSKQVSLHPPKVGKAGLLGVLDGMQQMKEGKVSGVKLVYRLEETD